MRLGSTRSRAVGEAKHDLIRGSGVANVVFIVLKPKTPRRMAGHGMYHWYSTPGVVARRSDRTSDPSAG